MKCGYYETFGRSTSRRTKRNQSKNVNKLIELFQRTNLFQLDDTMSRDFDENFFWSQVKIPKASGTDRDKKLESAKISDGFRGLFNVMCVPEVIRTNYAGFEEDARPNTQWQWCIICDEYSVAGADETRAQYNENSEDDEEGDMDKKIQTSLKILGNVQCKKNSPLLFKDFLGEDGNDAMHGMKEKHLKSLAIA